MVNMRIVHVSFGVLAVVCLLTGCSGPTGVAQTKPGLPDGVVLDPMNGESAAMWIERDETFAIVTWGSSSCLPIPTTLTVEGADRIAVTFEASPNDPCTANMAPTTHEFELPSEITVSPIVVEVSYEDWSETESLTLD